MELANTFPTKCSFYELACISWEGRCNGETWLGFMNDGGMCGMYSSFKKVVCHRCNDIFCCPRRF